jgi:putative transposase
MGAVMKKTKPSSLTVEVDGKPSVRVATRTEVIKCADVSVLQKTTTKTREKSMNRDIVLNYINELITVSGSLTVAIDLMLGRAEQGALPIHLNAALQDCSTGSAVYPSKSTLCLWYKNRREGGLDALVPKYKGRARTEGGWEGLAVNLYNQPSQPNMSSVHKILTELHGFDCSYAQVVTYLRALPAQLGKNSAARLGKNLHRLTQQGFVRRTTENIRIGDVYVADGYRADVYLAHPLTGDIFRPELTVAMDLRSRFIVGWRLDEHEGSFAVQSMWAEAFARHNHVPPLLYVDNGSGYKNSFVDDEITGFYARAGVVQIMHSIPGNPHGKGWIERFFRTMKEDFLRNWRPEFFCGHEMADEVRNKIVSEVKAKRLTPPSVAQFADAFNAWIERYHARPHPEEKQLSHADLWAGLVPIAPAMSVLELKYQAVKLKVRRASIKHKKLEYQHPDLYAFNGQQVMLEYDMMNNEVAIIRTLSGVWICDAHLVTAIDVIAPNRLEEKRTVRAADAVKRLEKKIAEQQNRSGVLIDGNAIADGVLELIAPLNPLINSGQADDDDNEIILDLY